MTIIGPIIGTEGGGDTIDNTSENDIPIKESGAFEPSGITLNPTLDRFESDKTFYAPTLQSDPSSVEIGDSILSAGGREVSARSASTSKRGVFNIQLYDDNGFKTPTIFSENFANKESIQEFDDGIASGVRENNFYFIAQSDYQIMTMVFKPEFGTITSSFSVSFRLNDVNNPPAYSKTIELSDPNLSDIGGGVWELKFSNPIMVDLDFELYVKTNGISLNGGNNYNGPDLYGDPTNFNHFPFLYLDVIRVERINNIDLRDYKRRQMIKSGVKGFFSVNPVALNDQIQITADNSAGSFEVFFNEIDNVNPDSQISTIIEINDQLLDVPDNVVTKYYHVNVGTEGGIEVSESKKFIFDNESVHLFSFVAKDGSAIPESIITNPWVTWSDRSSYAILESQGFFTSRLKISSTNNSDLGLQNPIFWINSAGGSYAFSKNSVHSQPYDIKNPINFTYQKQDTDTHPGTGSTTLLDPTMWDNAGTLTSVAGQGTTIKIVLITITGQFVVLYGQETFINYDDAVLNARNISFIKPPGLIEPLEVARIVIKNNATDTADTSECSIINTTPNGVLL